MDVQNWDILLVDFSFNKYEVSFPDFLNSFTWKYMFFRYKNSYTSLFLGFICLEKSYPFLWGYVYLCLWSVCCCFICHWRMNSVFASILLAWVILLGEIIPLILTNINYQWLLILFILLLLVVVVYMCPCACMCLCVFPFFLVLLV